MKIDNCVQCKQANIVTESDVVPIKYLYFITVDTHQFSRCPRCDYSYISVLDQLINQTKVDAIHQAVDHHIARYDPTQGRVLGLKFELGKLQRGNPSCASKDIDNFVLGLRDFCIFVNGAALVGLTLAHGIMKDIDNQILSFIVTKDSEDTLKIADPMIQKAIISYCDLRTLYRRLITNGKDNFVFNPPVEAWTLSMERSDWDDKSFDKSKFVILESR